MRYRKFLISVGLVAMGATLSGATEPTICKPPTEVMYTVRQGDTLWSIASQYMKLNTYGPRDIREFQYGIKELNTWLQTPERQYGGLLLPGDELRINYWTKDNEQ